MSTRTGFLATYVALLTLLAVSVGAALLPLGPFGPVVGLGIAATKTLLVAGVFMHLARRSGVTRLFAAAGVVWLALLFVLLFADYAARAATAGPAGTWDAADTPAGAPAPAPERHPEALRGPGPVAPRDA